MDTQINIVQIVDQIEKLDYKSSFFCVCLQGVNIFIKFEYQIK